MITDVPPAGLGVTAFLRHDRRTMPNSYVANRGCLEAGRISLLPVPPGPVSLPSHDVLQPSYCSTFKPEFQSETYTSPSVVTKISAAFAASATLGRGSISFLGVGGTQ